jgi:hypothetical protein
MEISLQDNLEKIGFRILIKESFSCQENRDRDETGEKPVLLIFISKCMGRMDHTGDWTIYLKCPIFSFLSAWPGEITVC